MPEPVDEHARLLRVSLDNARNNAGRAIVNKAYRNEYQNFVEWVKNQEYLCTNSPPFITPMNVDHYYTSVVAHKTIKKESVSRITNALEWYAAKIEIVPRLERELAGESFVPLGKIKDRQIVKNALYHQELEYGKAGKSNPGTDPHKGLKDMLSREESLRAMEFIFNDNEWGPLALHFNYGQNGAIRGASNRNLKFCDLKYSNSFVPEQGKGALLVVIRKGKEHKDRHEQDKQVCYWRHSSYRLCSVFTTAAYVISRLLRHDEDINFFHVDKKERAPWWDTKLTDWDKYHSK